VEPRRAAGLRRTRAALWLHHDKQPAAGFSRRVVQAHLEHVDGISLAFAIPDHPWVDASDAAAVRIAMSIGVKGSDRPGRLLEVTSEKPLPEGNGEAEVQLSERTGVIHADLRTGADLTRIRPLQANEGLGSRGVQLMGAGFIVTPEQASSLGLGRVRGLDQYIRPYMHGRDLTGHSRGAMVIDLFGLTEADVRQRFSDVYQWVLERVGPERTQNNRASYRDLWWVFGEPRAEIRPALRGLDRFIVTVATAKHRMFTFLGGEILPDDALIAIALSDPYYLGILSSQPHATWARNTGGTLEDRSRYNKSRCFDPFPFPDCGDRQRATIGEIAEELDGLRKERLRLHPDLTLTALYNVLAKLRSGESLTEAEHGVNDRGLVGVIRRLHDDLDRAVFGAYGWPADLADDDILACLVALNRQRTEEEWRGNIRWLRPEFQAGIATAPVQRELVVAAAAQAGRLSWPRELPDQFKAVRAALAAEGAPAEGGQIAARFVGARRDRVAKVLETLVSLGQARQAGPGRYAA